MNTSFDMGKKVERLNSLFEGKVKLMIVNKPKTKKENDKLLAHC